MSGAQWSPERLRELAQRFDERPAPEKLVDADDDVAAAASLRAFARVVSVLDDARAFAISRDGIDCLAVLERWEPPGDALRYLAHHRGDGDTPLAALLSLADALDAGRGDA